MQLKHIFVAVASTADTSPEFMPAIRRSEKKIIRRKGFIRFLSVFTATPEIQAVPRSQNLSLLPLCQDATWLSVQEEGKQNGL